MWQQHAAVHPSSLKSAGTLQQISHKLGIKVGNIPTFQILRFKVWAPAGENLDFGEKKQVTSRLDLRRWLVNLCQVRPESWSSKLLGLPPNSKFPCAEIVCSHSYSTKLHLQRQVLVSNLKSFLLFFEDISLLACATELDLGSSGCKWRAHCRSLRLLRLLERSIVKSLLPLNFHFWRPRTRSHVHERCCSSRQFA